MTKEKKWKKQARNAARKEKRKNRGWVKVTCQAICGCCEAVLWFENMERAEEATKAAWLEHATIKDDKGHEEEVDGFYGFDINQH
tara:strand:+ start:1503 stop:1757 length:255 start_codon:yes stop_codon:yes gene_type:complete